GLQGQDPRAAAPAGLPGAPGTDGKRASRARAPDEPARGLTRPLPSHPQGPPMNDPVVADRIKQDITDNTVVLYMKGTPVFPQCGFSAAVVQILTHMGVKFKGIDVLADPALRQGIKDFSSWPTIPQLYVKGEFVGGCDIIREMFESGELKDLLQTKGVQTRAA